MLPIVEVVNLSRALERLKQADFVISGLDGESTTTIEQAHDWIDDGTISGGMIPKITACIDAVQAGAAGAHMLDGRVPHVLLLELFTDSGIGTMLTAAPQEPS